MQTYLVTGGAGFIGGHLCGALLERGHRVLALDNLSTGNERNVAHLRSDQRFSLVVDSILNRPVVDELIAGADGVFHLAAAVGVRLVVQNATQTIETNVAGAAAVLEAASKRGQRVVLASSSEVYGKSSKAPFSEDDDFVLGSPTVGRWSYGCSKAMDEYLALAYRRERGLPVVIVRLFNTIGPRQLGDYGMVLPRFVRQALGGEAITVHGDGSQTRCFSAVGDVVGALVQLMEHPDAVGGIYNLGSDEEVSVGELARRVRAATRSRSPIVHVPYAQAWEQPFEDMSRRVPDLTRIRALIGFAPATRLDAIIDSVVEYERANPQKLA